MGERGRLAIGTPGNKPINKWENLFIFKKI